MSEDFKSAARKFLQKNGEMVKYNRPGQIDYYGWSDYHAREHCPTEKTLKIYEKFNTNSTSNCSWMISEGAEVQEETVSMFADTFADSEDEVLLIVKGANCKCGRYKNVNLGWSGGVGELMRELYSLDATRFTL